MNKKASVFITVFIVAMAISVFMLVNSRQQGTTDMDTFQPPAHYAESTSTYMYHALDQSGVQATHYMGASGLLDIDNGYLISYSLPRPPDLEVVKSHLGDKVKELMNKYLQSINGKTISGIKIQSDAVITKVEINVNEDDVFAGKYDNSFPITAESTGKVEFIPEDGTPARTFQESSFNVPIENWRYWYIYRKVSAWIVENEVSKEACNAQPQYGLRGNNKDCNYAPIDLETAKNIINEQVKKLNDSFDKDGICIWGCKDKDPDCEGDAMEDGTCAEDGFCKDGCGTADPDCSKCNLKDPYMNCTWTLLCGQESVWSKHIPENSECHDGTNPNTGATCPGTCVDGCEYENDVEDCRSGDCNDPYCPKPGTPDFDKLAPPCMEKKNITYTAGEYTGQYGIPINPGQCYGLGTKYRWSLIAEVTCSDAKNQKPVSEEGFDVLPFKFRIHQYFQERYHEAYLNPCEPEDSCMSAGGSAGGGIPPEPPDDGGGHSDPPPNPNHS